MSYLTPDEKKDKARKLREYHNKTLERLGATNAYFLPKLCYNPPGKSEKHVAMFDSELSKGVDIYIEFADKDFEPQDPERGLYKWRYNAHYKQEYDHTDAPIRYLIPVKELVKIPAEQESVGDVFTLADPESDSPLETATLRDLAAIVWKKPVSNKPWLNDFINKQQ